MTTPTTRPLRVLIAGGNSGIGLQAARQLVASGHHALLLGRDPAKGAHAVNELQSLGGDVLFLRGDLSTHDGVRDTAARILAQQDAFDAVVHTTGVLDTREHRTADGLHPMFAVSYLSRYHLTQLLLPALRKSASPRVVMMTARVRPDVQIDYADFPQYQPFHFATMRGPIQVANHHYAAHLARTEPGFSTAVINAGAAKTDIFRDSPWAMRAAATVLGPVIFNSLPKSAHNVVHTVTAHGWGRAIYWDKPGRAEHRTAIDIPAHTAAETAARSAAITDA